MFYFLLHSLVICGLFAMYVAIREALLAIRRREIRLKAVDALEATKNAPMTTFYLPEFLDE